MADRASLQALLETVLGTDHVYFQPPESLSIQYPAIVYSLGNIDTDHANDGVYRQKVKYTLIYIDRSPVSEKVFVVSRLPLCRFDRHYISDNLNHYVYSIYY